MGYPWIAQIEWLMVDHDHDFFFLIQVALDDPKEWSHVKPTKDRGSLRTAMDGIEGQATKF